MGCLIDKATSISRVSPSFLLRDRAVRLARLAHNQKVTGSNPVRANFGRGEENGYFDSEMCSVFVCSRPLISTVLIDDSYFAIA